ncbi:Fusaric acid resistance protein family protein (plasmid) [Caballeronia sp. SBC1]|uniref:FUSC family protein n=1 Tax=unclassified Caballeronia TaxID=2646786 RepID=UPI0013E1037A|nr:MULTISPECIES: FUSC family protein [unclassified Caballeronia]QIE27485.1 Fusaric acid resistance protein family protein [Caballeronia sp. SBC2]QIN65546.1 Fusaric acid resistance protein family protein [Caballeronia sp. SBC1]
MLTAKLTSTPELRRFARTLVSCLLSYYVAKLATLPELYWAVITTLVVVTQPSLNQALSTGRDQIIGAVIGGLVGVVGLFAILRGAQPLIVFAIALLPLAALAAWRPTLRLACVTLVVVVLVPASGHGSPYARPIDRLLEILIGAGSALLVAFLMPNRAINIAHDRASEIVLVLGELIALTLRKPGDASDAERLHGHSAAAEQALDEAITEAGREHIIVPVKRTRGDVIDKVAPMLTRLHRDGLFLGQAFAGDAGLAGRLTLVVREALSNTADAFDGLAKALAATLDADKRKQDENVRAAREAFERLRVAAEKANALMEKNTVLPFVLNLLVTDFGELVTTVEGKEG